MNSLKHPFLLPLATALALACAALPSLAVEGGAVITPPGIYDFGAGMLPPPSDTGTVGVRYAHTRGTQLRDDSGNTSAVGANLTVNSYALAFIKMSNTEFLGGKYGYSVIVPVVDLDLRLAVPTPVGTLNLSGKNSAVGDVQITPAIVQWTPSPGVFANASVQFQLPTGAYDKNRLINAGVNHWTVTPNMGFTYIHSSGFEVSSNIGLNFNTRNKATDYRSGVEYQHDFAIGQHVGPWTLGLGGYRYQQLTDDQAPGLTGGNRSRVTALGPAVSFFDLGSGWPIMFLHAYKEFGARNRAQGSQIAFRAAWTF